MGVCISDYDIANKWLLWNYSHKATTIIKEKLRTQTQSLAMNGTLLQWCCDLQKHCPIYHPGDRSPAPCLRRGCYNFHCRCHYLSKVKGPGGSIQKGLCAFVFTLSHSIIDGMASIALLKKFHSILNSIIKGALRLWFSWVSPVVHTSKVISQRNIPRILLMLLWN